jgi:hypothetical protein
MARARSQRKKDIRERFNDFLDDVFTSGRSFSMESLSRYEETGREHREQSRMIREATPRPTEERDVLGELIFRKVPREEAVRPPMTRAALSQTLDLAEMLDAATTERDLNFRRWVEREEAE